VRLDVRGVDHLRVCGSPVSGKLPKQIFPDAATRPTHETVTLKDLKRIDEAVASYDQAILLKPDYAKAYNNSGISLQDLQRPDEALASFDNAIALRSNYADAYHNRGNKLKTLKRLDEALACYDEAIALEPNYAKGLQKPWYYASAPQPPR
jgi:tetratricopeptide (TPR) repeat protein